MLDWLKKIDTTNRVVQAWGLLIAAGVLILSGMNLGTALIGGVLLALGIWRLYGDQ